MSRSYKKNYKVGYCCKGNIRYYKKRRKLRRHRLSHEMHNLFANYTAEIIDEKVVGDVMPKENQWGEPSDGHYGLWQSEYKADKAFYDKLYGKKIGYAFKPKRRSSRFRKVPES